MNEPLERDERALARLGRIFDTVDPIAPFVAEGARAAYTWRRVDAELAELLADSAADTDLLVGARRSAADARSVSFSAGTIELEVEIRDAEQGFALLGQLSPPRAFQIEVQTPQGLTPARTRADDLGLFRMDLPAGGAIRLRLLDDMVIPPRWVETGWLGL